MAHSNIDLYITVNGFRTGAELAAERQERENRAHKRRVRTAVRSYSDPAVVALCGEFHRADTWKWAAQLEAKRRGLTLPKGGE